MSLFTRLFGRKRTTRSDRDDPVVVGGTGGSGTRVVHGVLQSAGVYVGWRLNHAGDAMDFEPLLDRHVNAILAAAGSLDHRPDALPPALAESVRRDLADAVGLFADEVPPRCRYWGWKSPRSMYVLPFLAEALPRLRFVHLIRDGRDMAISGNQNQLAKHGDARLGDGVADATPDRSIALWAAVNGEVADFGERALGDRYLRVRFEDLCADPIPGAAELLRFAGLPRDEADRLAPEASFRVDAPATLGRWRTLPADVRDRLDSIAGPALARFGYL